MDPRPIGTVRTYGATLSHDGVELSSQQFSIVWAAANHHNRSNGADSITFFVSFFYKYVVFDPFYILPFPVLQLFKYLHLFISLSSVDLLIFSSKRWSPLSNLR